MKNKIGLSTLILLFASNVFAAYSFEGYLSDVNGPITTSVPVILKVYSPGAEHCVLYSEQFSSVTPDSDGYMALAVGSGTRTDGLGHTLDRAFANYGTLTGLIACTSGSSYTPAAGAKRILEVTVSVNGTSVTLGTMDLNPVPVASTAEKIAAHSVSSLLRVENAGVPSAATALTAADWTGLQQIIAGTSSLYMKSSGASSTGASLPVTAGAPSVPSMGSIWYDSTTNTVKYYNGSASQSLATSVSGASITASDISNAQGYTSLNRNGDDMMGLLGLYKVATDPSTAGWSATEKGRTWFNTSSNQVKYWDGSSVQVVGAAGSGLTSLNGQTGSTQTFATSISGTAPNFVSTSNVHTLQIPMASTAAVTAGLISKAEYDNFNTKLGTTTSLAGDISGFYNTTLVQRIQGKNIVAGSAAGQLMMYDGTQWVNSIVSGDATLAYTGSFVLNTVPVSKGGTNSTSFAANRMIASNGTGSALVDFTCTVNQFISFDASGYAICVNLPIAGHTAGSVTNIGMSATGTGSNLAAFGYGAAYGVSGANNTVIGALAANAGGLGTDNTIMGTNAANAYPLAGSYNTAIGSQTVLGSVVNYGIAIGRGASVNGSGGIAIGPGAIAPANTIVMGTNNAGTFYERLRIDGAGNVGIGISSPAVALDVNGSLRIGGPGAASVNGFFRAGNFTWSAGSVTANSSGTMSVSVPGAAPGDSVICNPRSALPTGASLYCYVSTSGTVAIAINNHTATAMTSLGSVLFDVMVIK